MTLARPYEFSAYLKLQRRQTKTWDQAPYVRSLWKDGRSLTEIAVLLNMNSHVLRRKIQKYLPECLHPSDGRASSSETYRQDQHIAATLYAEIKDDRMIGLIAHSLSVPEDTVLYVLRTRLLSP
jgi:hypothetical protein